MFVLRIALFLTIVLVVVVGGHVYLYRRLFRDTTGDRRIRRAGAIALALAGASLFLARSVFTRFHTAWVWAVPGGVKRRKVSGWTAA